MAIPKEIHPIGVTDRWIHALITAESGFGKTVFAGTAPNALFLTTDPEGTDSAYAMGSDAQEWEIRNWNEGLVKAYRYLRDGGIKELGLDWVIIDNVTEAQTIGMRETIDNDMARNPKIDEFIPAQPHYQRSQNMLREMVTKFHDLPVNVLWTAWPKMEMDPTTGEEYWTAGIHGQQGFLAQQITGYMNVVGMGQVIEQNGKEVRRIWFTHHDQFRGKDRFIALGAKRDNLSVAEMQKLIQTTVAKRRAERKKLSVAPRPTTARRAAIATPAAKTPVRKRRTT